MILDNRQAYPDVDSIFEQYQEEALRGDFLKRYPLKRVSRSFPFIHPINRFRSDDIFTRALVSVRHLETTCSAYPDMISRHSRWTILPELLLP